MGLFNNIKTALVLAPHPDDGEFGAGGTIHYLTNNGVKVYYMAFSPCVASVPDGFDKDILYKELNDATNCLGIKKENIITFSFPVRKLNEHRQDILEELIKVKKTINPDLVLLPNSTDIHQDHNTVYNEGIRAFKHIKIIGYELPWNNLNSTTNFHVKLSKENINAKANAIKAYKSQQFRPYSSEEFLLGLAAVRGTQVNANYAEAFELIRWVV